MNHVVQTLQSARPARQPFLPSPLAAALALAFAAGPGIALAQLPSGASVVSGSAVITTQGDRMSVGNSPNAIINWQSFSIGAGQSLHFQQSNAASQVLNRVVGSDPSQLFGTLSSNGRVWLVNPNGVLFGAGARIDVAGLVASTLGIADADFLAARLRFDGSAAGRLLNQGEIRTPTGGRVWLIGSEVGNEGLIEAPGGEILLAAGRSVDLVDASAPRLALRLTAPTDRVLNLGRLIAAGGRIELHGAIINQQGLIRADSAGVDTAGRIVLRAQNDLTLAADSVTSASAAGTGRAGEIVAQSDGGTALVWGRVEAVSAGGAGGRIALLGPRVGVAGAAQVDASGAGAGGELLVGGDVAGGQPALPNSLAAYVGSGASLRADATQRGDGGRVIVWSEEATRVHGALSARGGPQGGDGGLVETSGRFLDVAGARVETAAAQGKPGQWLLDPYDLQVQHGTPTLPPGSGPDVVFESSADLSTVYDSDISAALSAGSNVTLRTGVSGGTDAGDLTLKPGVQITHAGNQNVALKLDAYRNIGLANDSLSGGVSIQASGGGRLDVDLNADMTGAPLSQGHISLTQANVATNGGALRLYGQSLPGSGFAHGVSVSGSTISAGEVSISAQGSLESAGVVIGNSTINAAGLSISGSAPLTGININSSRLLASGNLTVRARADWQGGYGLMNWDSTLSGATGVDILGEAAGGIGSYLVGTPTGGGSRIESSAGAVNLRGLGDSFGLQLSDATTISGRDGVDLRGRASSGDGVFLSYPTIASSAGSILITGDAAGTSGTGLTVLGGTIGGAQQTADILLRARNSGPGNNGDSLVLSRDGVATRIQTQGSVVLLPGGLSPDASAIVDADDVPITINSTSAASGFDVGADDLPAVQPQTGSLIVGSDSHYGKITLSGSPTLGYDLTLQNRGVSFSGANAGIDIASAQLSGRTLTLASRGAIGQTAGGAVTADRLLVLSDSAAPVALTGANQIGRLTVDNAATLSFENTGDLVLGPVSGKLFAPSTTPVVTAIATNSSSSGDFTVHTSGALSLAQSVTTTDPVSTITLAAGGNFSSSGSLQPAGRFLVYDGDGPGNTNLGGVNYDFLQFDAPYPASAVQSGSGVLYATPLALSLHYSRPYDGTTNVSIDSPASLRVDTPAGYGVSRVDSPGQGYFEARNVSYNQPLSVSVPPVLGLTEASGKPVHYTTSSGFSYSGDITPRPVTLSATAADKVYDGNRAAMVTGSSLGGGIAGDDLGVGGLTGLFDTKNAGVNKAVTVSGATLTGADAGNYALGTAPVTTTATITPKPVTLSATAADKVYDGNRTATVTGSSLGGGIAGDDLGVGGLAGQFDTKNAGVNKAVTVSGATLTGADAGNYALGTTLVTTAATITTKPVTLGATAADKVYDGNRTATVTGSSLSGGIAGDDLGVGGLTGLFDTKSAGANKPVTVLGATLTGADAGNYALGLAPVTTTATITPKPVTFSATAADKVYDGNRAGTVTGSSLSGGIAGDDLGVGGLTGLFDTADVGTNKPVTVSGATLTGVDAGNYALATASAATRASITPAPLVYQDELAAVKAADAANQAARSIAASFPAPLQGDGVIDFSALPETASGAPGPNYFAPVNIAGMAPADLARLLESRREFKRKLFADAIARLEVDPSLADVQPCETAAQADSGLCRITPEQVAALQAASAPRPAPHPSQAALPAIQRKFALLFGLNDYQDRKIPRLESAIPDVDAVSRVFAERLGYQVRVVHNPGKADIVRALNQLSAEARNADSVVIYYAGHGYSLDRNGAGYWIPSDAPVSDPKRWISNGDVSRLIAGYRSTQVALISDSCYSGAFAREGAGGIGQAADAADVLARRSVVVLSSGGDEPVSDEGKEGHSIFAWNLMQVLDAVSGWTPGARVFGQVRDRVSSEFPQTPHYGAVSAAGHQPGGEYLFEVR